MRKTISNLLGLIIIAFLLSSHNLMAQRAMEQLTDEQIAAHVSSSVVLILAGRGAGRLEAVGSGLIVRADGVILTAYHLIRNAREVQVRLRNGDAYDRVQLIAFDARRDVAALRIPANYLPTLAVAEAQEARAGERVFVVSNPNGLAWTVSDGILSAMRPASEVSGAGEGYRLLQFTAPVSAGSSGGALVDVQGRALGIVVASAAGQNLNFAIPIESVAGLASLSGGTPLGTGSDLRALTQTESRPPTASAIINADPEEMLRSARTIYVSSGTSFFEPVQLQNALRSQTEFVAWRMLIVDGYESRQLADLEIEVDRPLFTYTFTYSIKNIRTGIVLATGRVTAFDGNAAAPQLAREIVNHLRTARAASASQSR
jgi:hypothetical protein